VVGAAAAVGSLLRSVAVTDRVIPQRELRNNIGEILRDAEAGVQFTITVRGRPVATLGPATPAAVPSVDVDARTVADLLARTPVDDGFAADIEHLRELEAPAGDPWPAA
jgi:prevent-host-death family protein